MWTEIRPRAFHLFDEPNVGHLISLNRDLTPQSTPVWVDRDGTTAVLNSAEGRQKVRNLRRNPFAILTVHSLADPYNWVQVRGEAALSHDGAEEHIHKLSMKYFGRPYPFEDELGQRVIIRLHATVVRCAEQRPLPDEALDAAP